MCFASGKMAYSLGANNGDTHNSCPTFNSAVRIAIERTTVDEHLNCSANVRLSPNG